MSREVYRQGIGGMWIQSLVLFLTPFYWFTALLFRRVRLTTIGDFFAERFQSPFLGAAYAVFTLVLSAFIGGGIGMLVAGKTMVAMTPKAIEQCTPAERASILEYREFQQLEAQRATGLAQDQRARWEVLRQKQQRGELRSFVSHINQVWFFIIYAVVVGAYTMMGGFKAAAVTDAIQGVLIIIFSVLLVPVGPAAHRRVRGPARGGPGAHVRAVRVGVAQRLRLVHRAGDGARPTSCRSSRSCRACRRPGRRPTSSRRASG